MNKTKSIDTSYPHIQGYKILQFLAAGSMGRVFSAIDLKHNREVAIKVMHSHLSNAQNKKRFLREVKIMSGITHDNIVKIYTAGQCADGSLYMVMQLVKGIEIHDLLKKKGVFSPAIALSIVMQAARGLEYVHRKGIVHRDVKPQNLVLDQKSKRVLLIDFGIAKSFDSQDLTRDGNVLGSPSFMSPEQVMGKHLTEKSDIYALGTVLFKLITGKNIYTGKTAVDVVVQHVKADVPKLPETHAQLQPLLDSMCSKDARDRPSSASVVQIIKALLAKPEIQKLPALSVPVVSEQDKEESIIANILDSTEAIKKSDVKEKREHVSKPVWGKLFLGLATVAAIGTGYLLSIEESLIIRSDKTEAVVYVDGQARGKTPLELADLSEGKHELYLVKKVSDHKRFVAKRDIQIPETKGSLYLRLEPEFLFDDTWFSQDDYTQALAIRSAHDYLTEAYAALEAGNLFSKHDSAYFLYRKAEKLGVEDPLFIQALDKKIRSAAQHIYASEGMLALKMYLADMEATWQSRPWVNPLLESIQAEELAKKKLEHLEKQKMMHAKTSQPKVTKVVHKVKKNLVYQDCSYCPRMVKFDAGKVNLGVVSGDGMAKDNEKKAYQAHLNTFYLAKNLVTVEQFALFLNAKKTHKQDFFNAAKAKLNIIDGHWSARYGSGSLPMTHISYDGAEAYCSWLGEVTALPYRLPTEEEWEAAARAGTSTVFWWGSTYKKGMANVLGTAGADQWDQLSPVASFPANRAGLYDMGGNVWQWTSSQQRQGEIVVKGGSWMNLPEAVRPSRRSFVPKHSHSSKIGFRCAKG